MSSYGKKATKYWVRFYVKMKFDVAWHRVSVTDGWSHISYCIFQYFLGLKFLYIKFSILNMDGHNIWSSSNISYFSFDHLPLFLLWALNFRWAMNLHIFLEYQYNVYTLRYLSDLSTKYCCYSVHVYHQIKMRNNTK